MRRHPHSPDPPPPPRFTGASPPGSVYGPPLKVAARTRGSFRPAPHTPSYPGPPRSCVPSTSQPLSPRDSFSFPRFLTFEPSQRVLSSFLSGLGHFYLSNSASISFGFQCSSIAGQGLLFLFLQYGTRQVDYAVFPDMTSVATFFFFGFISISLFYKLTIDEAQPLVPFFDS